MYIKLFLFNLSPSLVQLTLVAVNEFLLRTVNNVLF